MIFFSGQCSPYYVCMFTVIAIFRDTLVDKHRDKFSSNNINFSLTAGCRGCVRSQETG